MRHILQAISLLALIVTIVPPLVFLLGRGELATVKTLMLVATVIWFVVAPLAWQRGDRIKTATETQKQS